METQTSSLLCIFSYNRNFVGRGGRGGFGGGRGYYDRGPPESVTGRFVPLFNSKLHISKVSFNEHKSDHSLEFSIT